MTSQQHMEAKKSRKKKIVPPASPRPQPQLIPIPKMREEMTPEELAEAEARDKREAEKKANSTAGGVKSSTDGAKF